MVHLIVGNTGSGKTTYANTLKKEIGGIIFSIDKWNNILFIPDKKDTDGLQWFLERIERSESLIMTLIEQLENTRRRFDSRSRLVEVSTQREIQAFCKRKFL